MLRPGESQTNAAKDLGRRAAAVLAVVLLAVATASSDEQADLTALQPGAAAGIRFEAVPVETTGLADILAERKVAILERGDGKFGSHDWWLWGLSAFDYDNDGDVDLMVTIHGAKNGVICRSAFSETGEHAYENVTAELEMDWLVPSADGKPIIMDINGDGWLDVLGLSDETKARAYFSVEGKRFVDAGFSIAPTNHPTGIHDINGDAWLDIADHTRGREWIYSPGDGRFTERPYVDPAAECLPDSVASSMAEAAEEPNARFLRWRYLRGDLNGDGLEDVVLQGYASYGGPARGFYLTADRNGTFVDAGGELGLPSQGAPVFIGDISGDGCADVLVGAHDEGGLFVNDGEGRFRRREGAVSDFLRKREPYLHRAFLIDFNNDGLRDLYLQSPRYGGQAVFENRFAGEFVEVMSTKGWDSDPLAVADFDSDGRIDLAVGGSGSKESVALYLNRTPNAGNYISLCPRMDAPNLNAAGAVVEVWGAGDAGKSGAWLLLSVAPPDGAPIHAGLAKATHCDVRVRFPGAAKPVVYSKLSVNRRYRLTPDGDARLFKPPPRKSQ